MTLLPAHYTIGDDEVHIWIARLSGSPEKIRDCYELLLATEKEWADSFQSQHDRSRHVAGRWLARTIAGELLGVETRKIRFQLEAFGKPALTPETNLLDLRFNVSHSGDFVMVGFAVGREIGVDIEEYSDFDFEEVAKRFFSAREQKELFLLPTPERRAAFFRCWCRKEAYVKAHGAGLSCPTDQFDVSLQPGEPARLIATRPDPADAKRWQLRDIEVPPGYAAALAGESTNWTLKILPLLHV